MLSIQKISSHWCYPPALPTKPDDQDAASRTALAIGPFDRPQVSSPRLRPGQERLGPLAPTSPGSLKSGLWALGLGLDLDLVEAQLECIPDRFTTPLAPGLAWEIFGEAPHRLAFS